ITGMLSVGERASIQRAGQDSHFIDALAARIVLDAAAAEGTRLASAGAAPVVDADSLAVLTKIADEAAGRLQKEANSAIGRGEVESRQRGPAHRRQRHVGRGDRHAGVARVAGRKPGKALESAARAEGDQGASHAPQRKLGGDRGRRGGEGQRAAGAAATEVTEAVSDARAEALSHRSVAGPRSPAAPRRRT